jgi:hypothetical protein
MNTTTLAPSRPRPVRTPGGMHQLLTRDQYFALERLQGLLERRDAVDAGRLSALDGEEWLIRALDAAIVSYYRLACGLGLPDQAGESLQGYRELGLGSAA